jgi:uncharacterized ion transporter superfamily protein YfcC
MDDNVLKAEKESKFKMPDTYVIIFFLVVFAVILAYIVPAGSYKTLTNEAGKSIGVDPNSFTFTDNVHLSIADIFCSLYNGLKNGANTIFLVLIVGGVFQIILDTGAVDAIINVTINKLQSKAILIFPTLMLLMIFLGAVGIGINVALAFIPIGIALCKRFKLDPIVSVAMFYLSSNTGFSASPINPYTVLLAQDISSVQFMSGFGFRMIVCCIVSVISVIYVMSYCAKVMKDPVASIMDAYTDKEGEGGHTLHVTSRQLIIFISMILSFSYYTWGAVQYNWGLDLLSGVLVALGLFAGILGRLGANGIAKSFVEGCKSMVFSAMLVGFAGAISVVLTKGGVIHSIVHYICIPLLMLPKALAACGMYVANSLINIMIPSGSGQAYVVVPLMAPMADVLGFSRQVAISAFQYGDGFMNAVQPTTSLLMGCLGIAGIPYFKWLRFSLPLFAIYAMISCVALIIAVAIGWA